MDKKIAKMFNNDIFLTQYYNIMAIFLTFFI